MKLAEKSTRIVLGVLLLGAATNSLALSLGRIRGAAVVGRPLEATLSVQLDPSEGLSAVCAVVDVFFGDSQVPSSKVRTATTAGPVAGEALIRIRTTSVVDEPVVTLYVQEGCLQKNTTRKYVMLAEALADNAVPVISVSPPVVVQSPVVPGDRDARSKIGAIGVAGQGEPNGAVLKDKETRKSAKAKVQARSAGAEAPLLAGPASAALASAPPARVAGKPASEAGRASRARLKLDPIDLSIDRDPVLRASPELLTVPSEDAGQRAAAAALWQALNAQPQDMARDSQRLKSLEADVAGMLAQGRKTETAITELRGQLEQARGERYANGLVYALGAFLALALAVAASLWVGHRRHTPGAGRRPWWGNGEPGGGKHGLDSVFPDDASVLSQTGAGDETTASLLQRKSSRGVDLNLDELDSEKSATKPAARPAKFSESKDYPEFLPSGMPRIVNAEELFDVQQQADFFLSLGNTDQAVEVLLHHIRDNVETSALVYLDLFDLYHKLGRRDDYDALRTDFHRIFNAQVPAFDDYAMDSHGLEFYVAALTRIESLWPTPKVLDVLEESIFRKPDSRTEVFSLAAYRELLLLHSVAKKIIAPSAGPAKSGPAFVQSASAGLPSATNFGPTNILPLSAQLGAPPPLPIALPVPQPAGPNAVLRVTDSAGSMAEVDLTRPPASSRLGLDIDLSLEADEALAPLPSIAAPAAQPEPADNGNLIEFDLDTPISDLSAPKA